MSTYITSFSNIQIASNEAADYYTFNRAFSRLYDAVTTTSANVSLSASTVIPYATLNSPGFIQFTPTSAVSGVYDNYVISSNEMNSFLTSGMLTSAGGASYPSLSGVVNGGGLLLNGLSFQYGFATAVASGSTAATQVRILPITFATSGYMQFSQPPHLLYQILLVVFHCIREFLIL